MLKVEIEDIRNGHNSTTSQTKPVKCKITVSGTPFEVDWFKKWLNERINEIRGGKP